jgi:hypothetical protein
MPAPREVILRPFDSAQSKLREGSEPKPMSMGEARYVALRVAVVENKPLQVGLDLVPHRTHTFC